MTSSDQNSHWIGRIAGAIVVTGASFLSLCFWDSWGLPLPVIVCVAVVLGVLFLVFGGSVWRWIDRIDTFS
jgi:uncharacterized integral membrane protein